MSRFGFFRDLLIVAVIAAAMLLYTAYMRELPQPEPGDLVAHDQLVSPQDRDVEHVVLHTDSLGNIGFTVNLPKKLPTGKKLPIVMVLGGLDSGENNIREITNPGNNAIVGYDWPMPLAAPTSLEFLQRAPAFYKGAINAPAQIATAIDWLAKQDWADDGRISILGYSMGALAAPTAQEETQNFSHVIRWTIIAYGGAPLGAIVATDQNIKPAWMRYALVPLASAVFHPLEPALHLPHLSGNFLILEGKDDALMPADARATLRNAVPEPKTIVVFDGDHMGVGPEKAALLQQIIAASRDWLTKAGAVNPL